ncbi:hypothetical protein GA0070623_3281 [Micromonospora rifamycinica]|uniref:Uncharacterized protein n=1 Tax=Micromonospora rifamycinica TaxID=291594 RepID=A0A1C5JAB5_9ACTN|nr:hypothetical protein GA0070623_3281 [Micromonospora rifamycinica]
MGGSDDVVLGGNLLGGVLELGGSGHGGVS